MANKIANYVDNQIGKPEVKPVTNEEVDAEIAKLLSKGTSFQSKEGNAELGDTVNIDFEGFLEGVPFQGGKGEKYDLELGSGSFIPGFEDQLVGFKAGDNVEVNVSFPEQYHAENLAGKAVIFKCLIHEVKTKVAPTLNDEFAQKYGLPNVEELKKAVERKIESERFAEMKNKYLETLMDKLIMESEIDLEETAIEAKKVEINEYYVSSFAHYGMTLDQYLQMSGLSKEGYDEQVAQAAINAVKADAIYAYVEEKEGLAATEEEIASEIEIIKNYYHLDEEKLAQFIKDKKDEVAKEYTRNKVSNFLFDHNN